MSQQQPLTWLEAQLLGNGGAQLQQAGVSLPRRGKANFTNATLADNPGTDSTDITITFAGDLYTLDASSSAVTSGTRVALLSTGASQLVITKGTAAACKLAGGGLGLVLENHNPLDIGIKVAIGGTIPASITGLGAGTAGPVVWDATGRLKRARRSSGPGIAGYCDATGKVTLKELGYGGVTSPRHVFNLTDPAYGGVPDCDITHGTLFGDLTFTQPPTDNLAAWNAVKAAISASGNPGVILAPAPEANGAGYYFSAPAVVDVPLELIGDGGYGTGGGAFAPATVFVFAAATRYGFDIQTPGRGSILRGVGITMPGFSAAVARDQVSLASVNSWCTPSDSSYGYVCGYGGLNKRAQTDPSRAWPHDYLPAKRYPAGSQIFVFVTDDTNASIVHAYRYQATGDGVSDQYVAPWVGQAPAWSAHANYAVGTVLRATAANWFEYAIQVTANSGTDSGAVEPTWAGHVPADTIVLSGVTYTVLRTKMWPRDVGKTITETISGNVTNPATWQLVDTSGTIADTGLDGAFNWTVYPMKHAVNSVALFQLHDSLPYNFSGDGVHIEASVGGGTVANGWRVERCFMSECAGNGLFVAGDDTNASGAKSVTVQGCMGFGFDVRSFLGITLDTCQVAPRVGGFDPTNPAAGTRYGRGFMHQADATDTTITVGCYGEDGQPPSRALGPVMVLSPQSGAGDFDYDSQPQLEGDGIISPALIRSIRLGRSWAPNTPTMVGEPIYAVPNDGHVYSVLSITARGSTTAPVISGGSQPNFAGITVDGGTVAEVGTNGTITYSRVGASGSDVNIGSRAADVILSWQSNDSTTSYILRDHGANTSSGNGLYYGLQANGQVGLCAIAFSKEHAWIGPGFTYFLDRFVWGVNEREFASVDDPSHLIANAGNKGQQGSVVIKDNPTTTGAGLSTSIFAYGFTGLGGASGTTNRGVVYLEDETTSVERRTHTQWFGVDGKVDGVIAALATTDATANQIIETYVLAANTASLADYIVTAKKQGAAGSAAWKITVGVETDGAGVLTVQSNPGASLVYATGGLSTFTAGAITAAASATAGGLDIRATGIAATGIHFSCVRQGAEAV